MNIKEPQIEALNLQQAHYYPKTLDVMRTERIDSCWTITLGRFETLSGLNFLARITVSKLHNPYFALNSLIQKVFLTTII